MTKKQIAIRVDQSTDNWLHDVAQSNNQTVSEVIRGFIKHHQNIHRGTRLVLDELSGLEPQEALLTLDAVIEQLRDKINGK
ncbi:hypothetical protein [Nostoc parmelioides]|uniref:CopG family transcriptional regulator n=1 Tax=Nostoc parmelioides FACHB-3921 TaxID=2692909 RepID=A0ABR8BA80_9NOSO|nr:hypothetical protein [Nostoc parmelioides]MBD2250992.1 hypothetical protein [Nostoc parmelioides FACHB-3921]